MAFKRLEYCGVHVTTGTVSGVPTTTPTNEGSEHLVLDANGNILEYYIWTKDNTGTSKWVGGKYKQTDPIDVNNTAINYVPTASGNTNNLNSIVTDPSGDKWIIDANGDATKVTTTFTDVKYSKLVFVDRVNGNDTTGTGSDNKMFQTIAKALSITDGSGWRVVLAPGTYVESPTVQWPNVDIVTVAGSKRGNTYINGTVTFTHTSSSSGIQGIKMPNLVHSGAGALYVTDCQVDVLLNKTSAGYIEVSDTQLQGTSTSTLSAGTGLIRDSLIANMTISGATSGYTLKSNIIDATGTVTFAGGAIYNLQDNTGNIVTTAGVNMETALIAAGLPSAAAKQYMTNFSNKLAMLHPDTNNANVNVVSWNTVTKRLEVSNIPTGGGSWSSGTVTPTATGNTTTSLGVASLPAFYENTTTGARYYIDANGVSKVIESGNSVTFETAVPTSTTANEGDEYFITSNGLSTGSITASYIYDATSSSWILRPTPVSQITTTSLTPQVYLGSAYVNARANIDANVADLIRLSSGSYVHDGKITWTGHGLTVGAWYYLSQTTAGTYTNVRPTSGLVQQLFFVEDANTVHVDIEEAWSVGGSSSQTFANTVYFNNTTPASATIFDLNNPPVTNDDGLKANDQNIYIGTNGSTWTYNTATSTYSTYVFPVSTPLILHSATTNQTNSLSTTQTIRANYNTPVLNTFGTSWNATTGVLTIPKTGYYSVEAQSEITRAWAVADFFNIFIFVNGAINVLHQQSANSAGTYNLQSRVSRVLYLTAGQTLDVRVQCTGTGSLTSANRWYQNYLTVNEIK